jgi:transcriptional regulator with XRE-family HTH domain
LVRLTRLRRRRLEKGWTLADLARESGISRKTLGYIERGEREPRPKNIARLATVLGCEPKELMEPESP